MKRNQIIMYSIFHFQFPAISNQQPPPLPLQSKQARNNLLACSNKTEEKKNPPKKKTRVYNSKLNYTLTKNTANKIINIPNKLHMSYMFLHSFNCEQQHCKTNKLFNMNRTKQEWMNEWVFVLCQRRQTEQRTNALQRCMYVDTSANFNNFNEIHILWAFKKR